MSVVPVAFGIAPPVSPIGPYLGFTRLPLMYGPIQIATITAYLVLTQAVKMWLLGFALIGLVRRLHDAFSVLE